MSITSAGKFHFVIALSALGSKNGSLKVRSNFNTFQVVEIDCLLRDWEDY